MAAANAADPGTAVWGWSGGVGGGRGWGGRGGGGWGGGRGWGGRGWWRACVGALRTLQFPGRTGGWERMGPGCEAVWAVGRGWAIKEGAVRTGGRGGETLRDFTDADSGVGGYTRDEKHFD